RANRIRCAAQTVTMGVAGLPSGMTGSHNPSSISTGGNSTLTVSAGSSAVNGSATYTVSGAGSKSSASGSATDTVTGGGGGCPAGYHEEGGVCVPDSGCSTTGAGLLGLLVLPFALMSLRR